MSDKPSPFTKPITLLLLSCLAVLLVVYALIWEPVVTIIAIILYIGFIGIVSYAMLRFFDSRPSFLPMASLLVSISFIVPGSCVIGIILGATAWWRMRHKGRNIGNKVLASLAIVIGLGFSFFWLSLLYGCIMQAKDARDRNVCKENMTKLHAAIVRYAADNDDHLPPQIHWEEALARYLSKAVETFVCPAEEDGQPSYTYLGDSDMKLSEVSAIKSLPLLMETRAGRHRNFEDTMFVCFVDGNVTRLDRKKVENARLQQKQWTSQRVSNINH